MYQILLHRDGSRALTYGGARGDPSPQYTGRSGGGGRRKRERTWSARSRDLLCHRAALSLDELRAERGGTHRVIGHVTQASSWRDACARSTLALCRGREVNTTGIRTFLVRKRGRPNVALALVFFAYSVLIIDFKGVPMKLKIVALAISVE